MVNSALVAIALLAPPRVVDLVYVRHGETVANATGRYNSRTIDQFSAKGQAEVAALTKTLLGSPPFARILVSPSPRVLRTIAPYLRAAHRTAEVWPLLYECCTQHRPANAHPTRWSFGPAFKAPADLAGLFIVAPNWDRLPNSPDYNSGLAQVRDAVASFGKVAGVGRILVVGHSGFGGQFLHSLTGKWRKIDNAVPISVRVEVP